MDKFNVGDRVVLGEHKTDFDYDKNWCGWMDVFVGKIASLTNYEGKDYDGYDIWSVDVDSGKWSWRSKDMKVVSKATPVDTVAVSIAKIQTLSAGVYCGMCGEFYPYADAVDNFVCYGCKHYP